MQNIPNSFVFDAGEMPIVNGKANPNPDKGQITIYQGDEDLLMFQWKNITKNEAKEPLAVIPGDWSWTKINSPKGIIYMMKSQNFPDQKLFFYMQYAPSLDETISAAVKKIFEDGTLDSINKFKNDNPVSNQINSVDQVMRDATGQNQNNPQQNSGLVTENISNQFNSQNNRGLATQSISTEIRRQEDPIFGRLNISNQILPQTNQQGTVTQSNPQTTTQNISNQINPQSNPNQAGMDFISQFAAKFEKMQKTYPNLTKILTRKNILKAIEGLDQNQLNELFQLLPEGQKNMQGFHDNINSPQFVSALSTLSHALNSENLTPIISSFGLNIQDAAKCANGVQAFIKCIIEKYKKQP